MPGDGHARLRRRQGDVPRAAPKAALRRQRQAGSRSGRQQGAGGRRRQAGQHRTARAPAAPSATAAPARLVLGFGGVGERALTEGVAAVGPLPDGGP
ncbi:hypothetical protein [Streptomyces sp. NK08204]|uniref:hypothetical protein n=1 Tax=Streptomyces sp. NK08204 TaxID=2873260 RepID=UPI001CED6875|nr:hypothetical protein [Streptomyces sp. NK08204]